MSYGVIDTLPLNNMKQFNPAFQDICVLLFKRTYSDWYLYIIPSNK